LVVKIAAIISTPGKTLADRVLSAAPDRCDLPPDTERFMSDERRQFLLTLQHTIEAVRESEDTEAALREVRDRLDKIEVHVRETDDKIAATFWELLHALTLIKPRDE
jgi:hypothetical protein